MTPSASSTNPPHLVPNESQSTNALPQHLVSTLANLDPEFASGLNESTFAASAAAAGPPLIAPATQPGAPSPNASSYSLHPDFAAYLVGSSNETQLAQLASNTSGLFLALAHKMSNGTMTPGDKTSTLYEINRLQNQMTNLVMSLNETVLKMVAADRRDTEVQPTPTFIPPRERAPGTYRPIVAKPHSSFY